MKKAQLCRQGSLDDDLNITLNHKSLESDCPELIPENKTRLIIYIWDCRIRKVKKHKLAWFFRSTIQSMVDIRNPIKKGVLK